MQTLDIIDIEEFDNSFWFVDGKFWGKADQVDLRLLLTSGSRTEVSIRVWFPDDDADLEEIEDEMYGSGGGNFSNIEHLLA